MLIPSKVFLIKPNHFKINESAVSTNKFMVRKENKNTLQDSVFKEHYLLHQALVQHNINVICFENNITNAPDALFANNWISVHHSHETGFNNTMCVLYPMALENRRIEVRNDIIEHITNIYDKLDVIDLRCCYDWAYLEGTGSIVFDRINKIIFATLSPRTYYWKLMQLNNILNYKLIFFHTNYNNCPIYHTNVCMSIGYSWAVVCFEAIYECHHKKLKKSLVDSNKHIIEISSYQLSQYCGNIIELVNNDDVYYTVMSTTAYNAFTEEQKLILGNIIHVPFETIEKYGGGGVRCCITEI